MSGYSTTPNYNLRKPTVGADNDLWGGDWNINADTLDTQLKARADAQLTYVPLAGGVMSGLLTLSAGPTNTLHAATKGYTDTMVPLVGGTMTGLLTLSAGPSLPLHAATKGYADTMLPLTGGTATGQINATAFGVTPNDVWGAAGLAADMVWSIRDATAGVPIALMADGSMQIAAVATPITATMPVPKGYVDGALANVNSTYLPLAGGSMQGPLTVRANSAFDVPSDADMAFSVRDGAGNVALAVDTDGRTRPASLALQTQVLNISGNSLATAVQLSPCIADIRSCASGGGVQLNQAVGGVWYIQNNNPVAVSVWPATGAQLGSSAPNLPMTVDTNVALIVWQSATNQYAVAQADAGGGGVGYVFTGTGFSNPRDMRDRVADTVNINDLVAGIDPTGVTDNSTQIKAAHDLAYSLGYRYIRFPARSKIHAPFGGSASASLISNVIFTGERCTIDTYRKVIADPDGQAFTIPCDLTPDQMTTFTTAVRAATTAAPARVVMIGHSGINASNFIQRGERWGAMLKQKLATEYSNRPIQVVDRSIGGTAWPDFARNGPPLNHYGNDSGNPVLWASDYNRRWIEYIKDLQPVHAIYFQFGANDNGKVDVYAIQAALDEIAATFSPVPTIFATADFGRQIQDSFSGTYTAQEAQEFMHGIQRTLFRRKGLGFFDLGRMMNVYRDGYDDRDGIMNNFIDNFGPPDGHTNQLTIGLPWSYPATTLHFSVQINFGAMSGIFVGGRKIVVQIGNHAENILILERDGATNMIAFSVQTINQSLNFTVLGRDDFKGAQGPYMSIPRTLSQFNCSVQTNLQVYIDVHDALLTLVLASSAPTKIEQTYSMLVDRYGGYFTPSFAYDNGTSSQVTINQAASYQPNTYVPQLTDYEFLDSTLHFTRFVFAKLWTPVTNAARFV